ncbi:MAG: LytTR family DNA-binding domain-containing protein [Pseudomonadota bacterium]
MASAPADKPASAIKAMLQRPTRFVDSWWLPLGLGATTGAILVFILLFIEPMGTDRYEASFRTLRLAGYGLCVLLPFLIVHGLSRWWVERTQSVWRVWHELIGLALLIVLIFNLAYVYNAIVINERGLNLRIWLEFVTWVTLPYLPLLVPPGMLVRRALISLLGDRTGEERLVLQGRNQEDRLRLAASEFVFAEAEQNYVTLHFLRRGQPEHRLFRSTLAEIESQLPDAVRVHRSFLINGARVEGIQGNARKRAARLNGSDREIPVSTRFEIDQLPLNHASN